jgi:hypothetical protein
MKNIQLTSRRTDHKVLIIVGIAVVTLIAAAALRLWALPPLYISGDYLTTTDATDADIIHQYWPHRLVQPEWVSSKPDWFVNWSHAEVAVRSSLVGFGWLVATGGLIYGYIRLRKAPPNKSPEPTAVGAGSSAIAVHAVSRRWLSFFR